jgi:hypothetical protein
LLQHPHPPQLLQHIALNLFSDGVRLGVERGELVRELSQGSSESVVFAVIGWVLEVVAGADGVFAVVVFGFVVVEVDLAEESGLFGLILFGVLEEYWSWGRTSARGAWTAEPFWGFWFIWIGFGYSLRNAMMAVIKFWMLSLGGVVLPEVIKCKLCKNS